MNVVKIILDVDYHIDVWSTRSRFCPSDCYTYATCNTSIPDSGRIFTYFVTVDAARCTLSTFIYLFWEYIVNVRNSSGSVCSKSNSILIAVASWTLQLLLKAQWYTIVRSNQIVFKYWSVNLLEYIYTLPLTMLDGWVGEVFSFFSFKYLYTQLF